MILAILLTGLEKHKDEVHRCLIADTKNSRRTAHAHAGSSPSPPPPSDIPHETNEKIAQKQLVAHPNQAHEPPEPSTQAFLHIAFQRDTQSSTAPEKEQKAEQVMSITTNQEAKTYLMEVQKQVQPQKL